MTTETIKTDVGSYFIANYPPFSQWSKTQLPEVEAAMAAPPRDVPLGLYLHIPFCRKRCHFCYFRVYTDKDSAAIRSYVDATLQEFAIYAAKPAIKGRKPNFIYFGGGTPSLLDTCSSGSWPAGVHLDTLAVGDDRKRIWELFVDLDLARFDRRRVSPAVLPTQFSREEIATSVSSSEEGSRPFSRFHWKREVRVREQLPETAANLASGRA